LSFHFFELFTLFFTDGLLRGCPFSTTWHSSTPTFARRSTSIQTYEDIGTSMHCISRTY
jgi:hypothetical protein